MITCFDRKSKEEKENEDCNVKFMLDNEDLACLLSGGCLVSTDTEIKIKIELDM